MSNYYAKRDAKLNISNALRNFGWKIYGYKEDNSDAMTDYYDPAYWGGIAEKNGFVLVIDCDRESEGSDIKQYNKNNTPFEDRQKISKLEEMTIENGATEHEEKTAKNLIQKIKEKSVSSEGYEVIGKIPAHLANPNKSIWHIEKDGKIYDKGNSLTKFARLPKSYEYDYAKMEYHEHYKYYTDWHTQTRKERTLTEEQEKIMKEFKALILRFEAVINGCNACHDGSEEGKKIKPNEGMEKITVTDYKTEYKTKIIAKPENITENMHFILLHNFNYGCNKGTVYKINRITENRIYANRLNGKLTKILTGNASRNNHFSLTIERLNGFISKEAISFVEIVEVKTEIQREKWVKKSVTETPKQTSEAESEKIENERLQLNIIEDVDTRDNSKIWIVKVINKLGKEEYITVSKKFKNIGGYYSKFKHGFLFRFNPKDQLQDF